VREAASALAKRQVLAPALAAEIEALRSFRNNVVHKPDTVNPSALRTGLDKLRTVLRAIPEATA
jgi:uncharacterized protein YutE (UPF0331/DUF86 family)